MTYTHYSYENEEYVYAGDGSDDTNIYLTESDANFYEHVDVKLSIADPDDEGYSDILANVDYVRIYDEEGELVYQSSQLVHNSGTNDYNVLFADADGNVGDNPHSIAFYDTYTIEIAYEVSYTYEENGETKEYTESYVATIDKNSTYVEDEYYSYSGTNAYQLYNELYGTDYTADTFAAAVAAGEGEGGLEYYNEHGIALEGLSYFTVAAALCDTKDMTGQAGLDLALGINSLKRYSSTTWNFDIQKTLLNSAMTNGQFTFDLYEASYRDGNWYVDVSADDEEGGTNGYVLTVNGTAADLEDGKSVSIMGDSYTFNVDSSMAGITNSYYFILYENGGEVEGITYDGTVYGIKLDVTLNDASDLTDVTIEETYYKLEYDSESGGYNIYRVSDSNFELEDDDSGYTIYPFENSYNEDTSITVEKEWVDNDNAYETRPGSITVTVTGSDGRTYTLTLSDANEWKDTLENLPVFADDGSTITYEVTEENVEGYVGEVVDNEDGTYIITNTLTGETEISVEKVWADNDNAYETRPESITVTISGSDESTYTLTLSDENEWSETLGELPKYDSTGTEITYTVTETEIDGYTGTIEKDEDGNYTITNTLTDETEISVEKEWLDNDDAYETRPDSITVNITGSNGSLYVVTLSDENEWSDTLSELPKYDSTGTEITYEVTEETVEGYTGDVVENDDGTYIITNTLTGETKISVEKEWDDDENENNNRPESITVTVTGSDGNTYTLTLSAENEWSDTLSELPKYDSTGTEITYTVTEAEVAGYDGEVAENADGSYTITNTLQKTNITATKVWSDSENRDGIRPDSVQVQLKANGEDVGVAVTLSEDNEWTCTWEDLPVYANGEEITYTVEEVEPDGYTVSGGDTLVPVTDEDGNETGDYNVYLVNTHEDEKTQITVNKEWQDDNDDSARPGSVTVKLLANGETSGDAVTLDESNSWSYTWEDLYCYEDGQKIEYTVEETAVDGYDTAVSELVPDYDDENNLLGYVVTVTNTRTGETEIPVEKVWLDNDNTYETRPESITVTLYIGEEAVTDGYGNPITVTLSDSNDWKDTFTNLAKYDDKGVEISYTVSEGNIADYSGEVASDGNGGYVITNTLTGTAAVSGEKTWIDDENEGNTRPSSITIYLYADGEQTGDSVTVTAEDNWAWSFTDLPEYTSEGVKITYTIAEGEIEGYIPTYSEDNLSVTNALPEVHKYVSDPTFGESTDDELHEDEAENNNTLEYRMEADHIGGAHDLVLHDLLDDQLDISTLKIQSVTLYESEGAEGKALEEGTDYTISTGECTADCGLDGCSFEIHVMDEDLEDLSSDAYVIVIFDIDVNEGVEDFNDNYVDEVDNHIGLSFTVLSFASYATPDETETYSYGFDLFKYTGSDEPLSGAEFVMANSNGEYAQFEVNENTYLLTGWTSSKDDATAIISGSDGNAVVEGLHDGTFTIEETVAPEGYQQIVGNITVTITVGDDPASPTISATNATVDGQEVKIENTEGSDLITIVGSKTWDDGDDADGIRPDSIIINLLDDPDSGQPLDSRTVTAEDNWAWSFSDLPINDEEGNKINYIITEAEIDGYTYEVNGYDVTNTHTPENITGPGPAQPNPDTGTGPGPANPNPNNGGPGTVKTADTNNIALWLLLLVVSGGLIGTAGVRTIRKRRREC